MLRGYIAPLALAGVKVVGDFVDNWRQGLPSEMGLLNLFDPRTGRPVAIIDAAGLTDMRTGAVTAIGAKYLRAQAQPRARAHRRARHGLLERAPARLGCSTSTRSACIRAGRTAATRSRERLARDLGKPGRRDRRLGIAAYATPTSSSRLRASPRRSRCCKTEWITRGAFVVPYGTMSAVELSLTDIMDKIVVDDWGQCRAGQFGSLRAHVDAGKLSEATLTPSWARSSPGRKPGREHDDETILLWHRGLSTSDIALGAAMLAKAKRLGIGQRLRYA